MTMLVVELYDRTKHAEEAIDVLKNEGIDRSNIELVDNTRKKEEDQGFFASLFGSDDSNYSSKDLAEMGLPKKDAQIYAEEVRNGRTLLIVRCEDSESGHIRNLLTNSHPERGTSAVGERPGSKRGRSEERVQPEFTTTKSSSQERGTGETRFNGKEGREKFQEIEEELHVGKRTVDEGGVRVSSTIREEEVEEEIELRSEHVDVQRRKVDRPVEGSEASFQEETVEFQETREEPMIEKEARVKEEVVVGRDVEHETAKVRETLRHQDINIEEFVAGSESKTGRFEQFESDLRKHYNENFASTAGGEGFDDYSMAYRYGMALGEEGPNRGKSWAEVKPKAREDWESHYKGTWDVYHDAVYYGFQRIQGQEGEERPTGRM